MSRTGAFTWVLAAALVVTAAACTHQERRDTEETTEEVAEETGEAVGAVAEEAGEMVEDVGEGAREGVDAGEDMFDRETTIGLAAKAGSGVSGEADLSRSDDRYRLEVEIEGTADVTGMRGSIVRGSCERDNGEVVDLESFTLDSDGPESVTEFPTAWLPAAEGPYAVWISGRDGTLAACGTLDAEALD